MGPVSYGPVFLLQPVRSLDPEVLLGASPRRVFLVTPQNTPVQGAPLLASSFRTLT